MLVCSMQEDARREKGLKMEPEIGIRDGAEGTQWGDSQGGRTGPKMSAS